MNDVVKASKIEALIGYDENNLPSVLETVVAEAASISKEILKLNSRLASIESLIAVADRIAKSGHDNITADYPDRFSIDARHSSLSPPEFYYLEYSQDGTCLRWTGPERKFSFTFFLDRSKVADFTLEFERAFFLDPLETLACYVDGQRAQLTVESLAGGYVARGVLPIRTEKGGTVVTFICPGVRSPQEEGSDDNRNLGLRFRRFSARARSTN